MKLEVFRTYVIFVCSVGISRFISGFISTFNIAIFTAIIGELNNNSYLNNVNGSYNESYNYEKLGFLFAAKSMTLFLLSPVSGILIDKFSPTFILLAGFALRAVSLIIFAFARQYYLLIVSRLIEGCATSGVNCALDAVISYQFKGYRVLGFLYGVYHLFLFIGLSVGPVVGGTLDENYGRQTPFLLGLLMTVCEAIIVVVLYLKGKYSRQTSEIIEVEIATLKECLKEGNDEGFENENKEVDDRPFEGFENENKDVDDRPPEAVVAKKETLVRTVGLFLCDWYVLLILVGLSMSVAVRATYFTILPRYMFLRFGVSEFEQGAVFIFNIIGYTAGFFVGGFLNMCLKEQRYIILIVVSVGNAITVMSMAFVPNWWSLSLPLCVFAFLNIIFDIVISPIFASVTEKRHRGMFGVMSGLKMMNIAQISMLSCLIAPIIFREIGFLWLNFVIAIFNLLSAPTFYFLRGFS